MQVAPQKLICSGINLAISNIGPAGCQRVGPLPFTSMVLTEFPTTLASTDSFVTM